MNKLADVSLSTLSEKKDAHPHTIHIHWPIAQLVKAADLCWQAGETAEDSSDR